MTTPHHQTLAAELDLRPAQVAAIAELLADGATVPFIARYRKEATGSCDEVQITAVRDGLERLAALDKRRAAMLDSLRERDLLTAELQRDLESANDLTTLEDRYLPFRPKRRTRAQVARENGLAPLAEAILQQQGGALPDSAPYVAASDEIPDAETALAGARDIIAETIAEDPSQRQTLRSWFLREAQLVSTVVRKRREDAEAARFRDWFDWRESLATAPSHRILALLRGAEQKVLRVTATIDDETAVSRLQRHWCRGSGPATDQVAAAAADAWNRLLGPSLTNEALGLAKQRADADAIAIFQQNLRDLLLAAPLGAKRVLAIDPGLRTGCKVAILDAQGALVAHDLLHLATDRGGRAAADRLAALIDQHRIEAIALGNGTGSREAEQTIRDAGIACPVCTVDESGASIYSASAVARNEFPDLDLTVRGAISIGRRLQDPLAEMVKLDPSSIGVGQYQHDVDQSALKRALDDVVTACVNQVGVELATASPQLLAYVSGLGPKLAAAIVAHRESNGAFSRRSQLKKVPRLGAKAFEQCAGFLRIRGGPQPLDASAVHPERYALVEQMAADLGADVGQLLRDEGLRRRIDIQRYRSDEVGEPTLRDILAELARPGRDPRPRFERVAFADVHRLEDLVEGMVLPGVVTNVTAFGAFVDVGVHQDGLVHISQLADRFVRDPTEVVRVRQAVQMRVLSVDPARRRIALSMRSD